MPAVQLTHALEPTVLAYNPTAQLVQLPPPLAGCEVPAAQFVHELDADVENMPAVHSKQLESPVVAA